MIAKTKNSVIWFDGKFVAWEDAAVSVLTHSLHYGYGIFEGIRAYKNANGTVIFRGKDHIARLFRSAHIFKMKLPYNQEQLQTAQRELLRKNKLAAAYIRPLCFYGDENLSLDLKKLSLHVMIAAWEWQAVHGDVGAKHGIKVKTVSIVRNAVNSIFVKAKATGNYLNSILAMQEAQDCGYEEALLLDQEGFVCEGSGENIFIIREGKLYTPDLSYALEGITRDSVMQLATDMGLLVAEKRITRDELYIADEAFFTGTAAEIVPIAEVDNRIIGSGKPGPITQRLQTAFHQVIRGDNNKYSSWLDWV